MNTEVTLVLGYLAELQRLWPSSANKRAQQHGPWWIHWRFPGDWRGTELRCSLRCSLR